MYTESQLKTLKKTELKALAKEENIKRYSTLNKEQLVTELACHYRGKAGTQHGTHLRIPDAGSTTPGLSLAQVAQTSASQQAFSTSIDVSLINSPAACSVGAAVGCNTPLPIDTRRPLILDPRASETSGPPNQPLDLAASPKPSHIFTGEPNALAGEHQIRTQKEQRSHGTQPPALRQPPSWIANSATDPARARLPSSPKSPLAASKIPKYTLVPSKVTTTKPFVPLRQIPRLVPPVDATYHPFISQKPQQAEQPPQYLPLMSPPGLSTEALTQYHVNYISKSWIESLFQVLNATRVTPILQPPYPAAIYLSSEFPSSKLAFQGLHPSIYELPTPLFATALRFWTSRLHTVLSLDAGTEAGFNRMDLYGPDLSLWPTVVKCEMITNEIGLIETQCTMVGQERQKRTNPASLSTTRRTLGVSWIPPGDAEESLEWIEDDRFIILLTTGEVISYPMRDCHDEFILGHLDTIRGCPLRQDFFRYIFLQMDVHHDSPRQTNENFSMRSAQLPIYQEFDRSSILQYVKTKDSHDFPGGISKHWWRQLGKELTAETVQHMAIAKRTVLSSCMLNGISGSHLSLADQEASCTATAHDVGKFSGSKQCLILFLPEPYQVLSVHLLGTPYHPGIAFVARRSGNTDIVLRSTGQSIGNQDYEGVSSLWRGVLGCDSFGKVVSETTHADFWRAWEARTD